MTFLRPILIPFALGCCAVLLHAQIMPATTPLKAGTPLAVKKMAISTNAAVVITTPPAITNMLLTWNVTTNFMENVQVCTNLANPMWQNLTTSYLPNSYLDTNIVSTPQKFYRIVIWAPSPAGWVQLNFPNLIMLTASNVVTN